MTVVSDAVRPHHGHVALLDTLRVAGTGVAQDHHRWVGLDGNVVGESRVGMHALHGARIDLDQTHSTSIEGESSYVSDGAVDVGYLGALQGSCQFPFGHLRVFLDTVGERPVGIHVTIRAILVATSDAPGCVAETDCVLDPNTALSPCQTLSEKGNH